MGKKVFQVSLAILIVLAVATMACAQAKNVASTSKKGMLLVFPKVIDYTVAQGNAMTTYFFIGNDNTVGTYVKCYWMDDNQNIEDFEFEITANQPIYFSTKSNDYGPPFQPVGGGAGSLTCWATIPYSTGGANDDAYMVPRKFEHLYGYAMIVSDQATDKYVFYNAFSFNAPGLAAGTDGEMHQLCTKTYNNVPYCELPLGLDQMDSCPKYLVTTFVTGYDETILGTGNRADLALWPCKQDLRQDRKPTCTKAKYDVWNGWEVKFTGAYQCFKCFFEGFLEKTVTLSSSSVYPYGWGPGYGKDKFLGTNLKTDVARLRVEGIASSVCDNGKTTGCTWVDPVSGTSSAVKTVPTGLLGVLAYGNPVPRQSSIFLAPGELVAGHTLHGAGYTTTAGFIYYDKDSGTAVGKTGK